MRNPNGFGSVVKLSATAGAHLGQGVTLGFDERGYPKYKFLSYHEKREDALMALARIQQKPL